MHIVQNIARIVNAVPVAHYSRVTVNVEIFILLFVCFCSGPATDDKHCFDCIFLQLVLSTSWVLVALTKYQKAFDNVQNRKKSESGLGLTQLKIRKCNEATTQNKCNEAILWPQPANASKYRKSESGLGLTQLKVRKCNEAKLHK